jgi:hypothetical protein
MHRTAYLRDLDVGVRYRVEFVVNGGQVLEFVVQLEVESSGLWKPVIRFDTAHGFAHCDRYKPDGSVQRHEPIAAVDFNQALTVATSIIRAQWEELSRTFRETIR